jgi:hypothetical protein
LFRSRLYTDLTGELLDVEQDSDALAESSDCYEQHDDVHCRQGEDHQTQHIVDVRAQEAVVSEKHVPTCREVSATVTPGINTRHSLLLPLFLIAHTGGWVG